MKLLKLLGMLCRSSGSAILRCGVPVLFSSTMLSPQPAHTRTTNHYQDVVVSFPFAKQKYTIGLVEIFPHAGMKVSQLACAPSICLSASEDCHLNVQLLGVYVQHHSVPSWICMEERRSQLRWNCRFTLRLAESHCRIVPSQLQEYIC